MGAITSSKIYIATTLLSWCASRIYYIYIQNSSLFPFKVIFILLIHWNLSSFFYLSVNQLKKNLFRGENETKMSESETKRPHKVCNLEFFFKSHFHYLSLILRLHVCDICWYSCFICEAMCKITCLKVMPFTGKKTKRKEKQMSETITHYYYYEWISLSDSNMPQCSDCPKRLPQKKIYRNPKDI